MQLSDGIAPEAGCGPPAPASANLIEALLTLLHRESNPANVRVVRTRLVELGPSVLPWLDRAVAEHASVQASSVALEIRRRQLNPDWRRWASHPHPDLEQGVLLIDRFGDPAVDQNAVRRALDGLASELRRRLIGKKDADTVISILTEHLFGEVGLRGNTEAYDEPENSYLGQVLARKRGIPVSLSVVVMLVGHRVGLPIAGIGMPGHFLVRYGSHEDGPFLDAFGGGRRLTKAQCAEWLEASGFEFAPRMLRPVSSREIVARMLRNLITVFKTRESDSEVAMLSDYLDVTLRSTLSPTTMSPGA